MKPVLLPWRLQWLMLLTAIFSLLILVGCEKNRTGIIDSSLNAPRIVFISHPTSLVHIDTTAEGIYFTKLPDRAYRIGDSLFVQVTDADGAETIDRVQYRVFRPASADPWLNGTLLRRSREGHTASYAGFIGFTIQRAQTGQYDVEILAQDRSNLKSNSSRISILVVKNNIPPQIFSLSMPDTLVRPRTGSRPVRVAVSTFDMDGLDDIRKVFFKSVTSQSPDFEHPLFDDGNLSVTGDSVARDGRYANIFPLTADPGQGERRLEFRFWARDMSGALSDSLVHFVEVLSE